MSWPRRHRTVDDTEESVRQARARFLERSDLLLLLFLKGSGALVGGSGLHRIDWSISNFGIDHCLRAGFTGRGLITEAVKGISDFAICNLGARRVEIRCDSLNGPSIRFAERAGFYLEGELRNHEVGADGNLRNTLVYSMLPG